MIEALAFEFVTFHLTDGRAVQVNPAEVVQLVHPKEDSEHKLFTKETKCVVRFTDGSFVAVLETCEAAEDALEQHSKE